MNMMRKSSRLLKVIVFFFFINSLALILYFLPNDKVHESDELHSQRDRNPLSLLQSRGRRSQTSELSHSKPWPILPSQLPWSGPQPPPVRSCEAFFGNGYGRRFDLVKPGSGGWFACRFSETLRSSVCEGGRVRMTAERVRVAQGGERLEDVIGRSEEAELPEFEDGAFEVDGGDDVAERRRLVAAVDGGLDEFLPAGEVVRHTMRGLVGSTFVVPSKDFHCDQWIEEPTIFVTRFEYANMFHTVTDWYSAYVASRVTGLPKRPHLVFVDGHCRTQLEDTWRALFSSLRYAKNFTGSVCFRHAVLVPLGYETVLFKGLNDEINCYGTSKSELIRNPNHKKTARLSEFGEMIRSAFKLPVEDKKIPVSGQNYYNVLFIRREDYLAHPRHVGKVESRLSNEEEIFHAVKVWALSFKICRINVVNGLFGHMSMKEQVRAIRDADVIVGAHGAGLTHIVSASPRTVVLEIISSLFRRPHFQLIARWKGLDYRAINLPGTVADPKEVVASMNKIMKSLGC